MTGHLTLWAAWVAVAGPPAGAADAFVLADAPRKPEYEAQARHAQNPTGGAVVVRRRARGRYSVRFEGLAAMADTGRAAVTAYGPTPERCSVEARAARGQDLLVIVHCALDAEPRDTQFSLLISRSEVEGAGRTVEANRPLEPRYQVAWGGAEPATVRRVRPGGYTVRLAGQAGGGNVQVAARGDGPHRCKLVRWLDDVEDLVVKVACFGAHGRPGDEAFRLRFVAGARRDAAPTAPAPPGPPRPDVPHRGPAAETALGGDGAGGRLFRDACPRDQALIELRARVGGEVRALAVRCGRLLRAADGRAVIVRPDRVYPFRGGLGDFTEVAGCPPHQVAVGVKGRAVDHLVGLALVCASLTVDAEGQVRTVTGGASAAVGGVGGRPFPAALCPTDAVAALGVIRADEAVHAFGLGCSRVEFRPPEP